MQTNTFSEINLKVLFEKIIEKKWLFVVSLLTCLSLAYFYTKWATPIYEVQASMLLDSSGNTRQMGESRYMDGGVGLIGTEKNLFNEIGIIKSFSLLKGTLEELNFDISYYSGNWWKQEERYGYFPFEVDLVATEAQLFDVPFYIEMVTPEKFRLNIEAEEFMVSNPETNTRHEVNKPLSFSKVYSFGDEVVHDYFHFVVKKPSYKVVAADFEDMDLFFKINNMDALASSYRDKLVVDQVDIQGSILSVKSEGAILDKEIGFLGKLCENFISSKFLERDEIAASKEDFIRKQLLSVSDSLSKAEKRLETFRRGANAVNLTVSASQGLGELQRLESDQGQIELNIKYYQSLLTYLKSNNINKVVAPSVAGIDDPLLNENLLELKRLNGERTRLKYYQGSKSYDLEIVDQQIRNTANALRENLRNLIGAAKIRLRDKNGRIASMEKSVNQLPSSEKQLLNFERKSGLYENLYNYLSQELAKTGIAKAEDISDTKVLDAPRMVGNGPVAPQKMLIMALGGILGLMFPLGWIVFAGSFAETIETAQQVEQYSTIPLAATINHFKGGNKQLVNQSAEWDARESFRDLGARLQFFVEDRNKNVLGFTSMNSGEGKTFCAVNLAVSLAEEGKKVVLLDLNLRKEGLSDYLGRQQDNHLLNYLQGHTDDLGTIIQQSTDVPGLQYIAAANGSENPHRLLSSERLSTLIESLKTVYDYVILDTPALKLVSDYLLISKFVDIHLFVVRRNVSQFAYLPEIEKLCQSGKMDNCYYLFNDDRAKSGRNEYRKREGQQASSGIANSISRFLPRKKKVV